MQISVDQTMIGLVVACGLVGSDGYLAVFYDEGLDFLIVDFGTEHALNEVIDGLR